MPATQTLPNHVASKVDSMAKLAPDPKQARDDAFKLALSSAGAKPAPKPSAIAASVLAVIIMGGYIWLQNYPKLAVRNAAEKAGIAASVPSYVPAGYRLGPVTYARGQITLSFRTATPDASLSIAQRRTDWDTGSLVENYLNQRADQYLTVEGQGLTIYLYDGNHATWVNRGVWYTIEGTNRLNREQILKIAYSL